MSMRRYEPSDYPTLCSWWALWGVPKTPETVLPKTGFISDFAAAFLLKTDGPSCFIEELVCNPMSSRNERSAGITEAIETCIEHAKQDGFLKVCGLTNKGAVEHRVLKMKFARQGSYTLLSRSL